MMIEDVVIKYLSNELRPIVAYAESQSDISAKQFVIVQKTGGTKRDKLNTATLAIQSYAESMAEAAKLNDRVKSAMERIVVLDRISHCELNSDYNYTDTTKKKYRYQAVFDLVFFDV